MTENDLILAQIRKEGSVLENPFNNLQSFKINFSFDEDFYDRFYDPFYAVRLTNLPDFKADYDKIREEVSHDVIRWQLGGNDWRSRMIGAFFSAIESEIYFEDIIGVHLLKSEFVYEGIGHSMALASFNTEKSRMYLKMYLDFYLKRTDLRYNQDYVYSALVWTDKMNKTEEAKPYLELFNKWIIGTRCVDFYLQEFQDQMNYLNQIRVI